MASVQASSYYWISTTGTYSAGASWSTVATAATPAQTVAPTAADDIFFSINSVTTDQLVNLNANNQHVRSMTFRGANTYATTIQGATARNFFTGSGGITMDSGAGTVTIGSSGTAVTLFFDADQTWTQNSSNALNLQNVVNIGNSTGLSSASITFAGTGTGGIVFNNNLNLGQSAGSSGYVRQTSGVVVANNQLSVGANSGYGYYALSSGTLAVNGGAFRVATGGNVAGSGALYVSGGSLVVGSSVTSGLSIVGSNSTDTGLQGQGVLYATGGSITSASGINVGGRSGVAQMTLEGPAVVISSTNIAMGGASSVASGSNSTGIVNLNGGLLEGTQINKGTGSGVGTKTAYFNFNGGTLRAGANNATFMQGLDGAYVRSGGATIDTNAKNITIAQSLLAPSGTGISSIAISGTGYRGAPVVSITGGGGTGATAVATIDGSGNLTIKITNAGVGYTSTPTVTLTGGEGGVTSGTSVNFAANTSGGLTKVGSGTLTLTGNNTYTGATQVNVGTLIVGVSGTGSLGNTAVTVASGATLGGSGTVGGAVTVSGTLAPGNSPGTLTINNSLTLNDGAAVQMQLSGTGTSQYDHVNVTGTLTLDGTIAVVYTDGFTAADGNTFNLFSGWTGSIVDNGYVFDFSQAVLGGGLSWDTSNFLSTGSITVVPEPGTWALLGVGAVLLGWQARKRRLVAGRR